MSSSLFQARYLDLVDESDGPEHEVGYRVRLWLVFIGFSATTNEDRQAASAFSEALPSLAREAILPVSRSSRLIDKFKFIYVSFFLGLSDPPRDSTFMRSPSLSGSAS